jgi:dsDNA-specific endonuclease/ATPase MutS2
VKSSKSASADAIVEGDMVKWEGQPVPGEVMEIRGKDALIAFGQLITNVKVSRLEKLSRNEYKKELRGVQFRFCRFGSACAGEKTDF